jgi:hypothetical protein
MKWLKFILIPTLLTLHGCASMGVSAYPLAELTEKYTDNTSKFLVVDELIIHYRIIRTSKMAVFMNFAALPVTCDGDKVTDERYFDLTMRQGNCVVLVNVFRTMKEQSHKLNLGDQDKRVALAS